MILMQQAMMGAAGQQAAASSGGSQLYHGFDDDPLDALPAWLANRWAPADSGWRVLESSVHPLPTAFGTRALYMTGNVANYDRCAFEITDAAGSASDEIKALLYHDSDAGAIGTLILRGAGTSESSRSGYSLWIRNGTNNFEIRKAVSGSETTLASGTLVYADGDQFVTFSAVENGTDVNLAATVHPLNDASQSTTLTATDSAPLAIGWPGIGTSSEKIVRLRWGWVGVGSDGAAAPTEPV